MKREVCKKCGFKIRGEKHDEGDHHKQIAIKHPGKKH